jgi:regulator of chromosome condensation
MLIPGLKDIVQISAGNNFCLALDSHGKIFSWGRSEQSQLGRRPVASRHVHHNPDQADDEVDNAGLIPKLVALPPRKKIVSIHAGSDHAFAIDSVGDTWAWGLNNYGQTGIRAGAGKGGTTVFVPQKVASLVGKKMKIVQGGTHHSMAITQNGDCLVWGRMDGCQMGVDLKTLPLDDPSVVVSELGKPRILLEPTVVPIPSSAYGAAGSDHNIIITLDGKAFSWGFNANYQCGQGPDTDDIEVATLIDNTAVRDKKLIWAGAGGQYSILAGLHKKAVLANGV